MSGVRIPSGTFPVRKKVYMVGIAQLVSAPDCGSGGLGFESQYPPCGSLSGNRRAFRLPAIFRDNRTVGHRQAVRHRVLIPASAGSNPAGPGEKRPVFTGRFCWYMPGRRALRVCGKCVHLPFLRRNITFVQKIIKNLKIVVHFADKCGMICHGM